MRVDPARSATAAGMMGVRGRPRPPSGERLTVLYVGGYSRSGGTLLSRILGQIPGFVAPGELGYLWKRGVAPDRLCGCGTRFSGCAFWRQIGIEAFGGWEALDVNSVLHLEREVKRHRFIPFLARPDLSVDYERKLREYTAVLERLYRAISETTDSRVIVDSTLDPAYAFALRHVRGIDLRVVHLVRDSRGTAYSWSKRIRRPDTVETGYLRRYHPAGTALRWSGDHMLVHLLQRLDRHGSRVLYEDLVEFPEREIRRILSQLGEPVTDEQLSFIGAREVALRVDHTVAGNRIRFEHGALPLRLDDEWRTGLDGSDRRLVTLLSWPLLRAYGYVGMGRTR